MIYFGDVNSAGSQLCYRVSMRKEDDSNAFITIGYFCQKPALCKTSMLLLDGAKRRQPYFCTVHLHLQYIAERPQQHFYTVLLHLLCSAELEITAVFGNKHVLTCICRLCYTVPVTCSFVVYTQEGFENNFFTRFVWYDGMYMCVCMQAQMYRQELQNSTFQRSTVLSIPQPMRNKLDTERTTVPFKGAQFCLYPG